MDQEAVSEYPAATPYGGLMSESQFQFYPVIQLGALSPEKQRVNTLVQFIEEVFNEVDDATTVDDKLDVTKIMMMTSGILERRYSALCEEQKSWAK